MGLPFIPQPPPFRPPSGNSLPPINLPRKKVAPPKPAAKSSPSGPKVFTRAKVRESFKKVENTWDIKMVKPVREKEEKKLFSFEKYGYDISDKEAEYRIKKLKEEKFRAKTEPERLHIEHEINLIRKGLLDKKKK